MNSVIDQRLHDEVRRALEPGEVLLWAGRPDPCRFAREKIVQTFLGGLFLMFLYLMYRSSLSNLGTPENAILHSFTLRSAILMFGGMLTLYSCLLPILAYRKARRTAYMATDSRIVSLRRGGPVQTLRYDDMQFPTLELDRHHSGDIVFSRKFTLEAADQRLETPLFMGIREVEQVHRLVLERISGRTGGQTTYRAVQDYLELLLQGKRTLDEDQ